MKTTFLVALCISALVCEVVGQYPTGGGYPLYGGIGGQGYGGVYGPGYGGIYGRGQGGVGLPGIGGMYGRGIGGMLGSGIGDRRTMERLAREQRRAQREYERMMKKINRG